MNCRYQDCPFFIRLWRRANHQPVSWLKFAWWVTCWTVNPWWGGDDLTVSDLWRLSQSQWHIKANWLYDLNVMIAELRKIEQ